MSFLLSEKLINKYYTPYTSLLHFLITPFTSLHFTSKSILTVSLALHLIRCIRNNSYPIPHQLPATPASARPLLLQHLYLHSNTIFYITITMSSVHRGHSKGLFTPTKPYSTLPYIYHSDPLACMYSLHNLHISLHCSRRH